MEKLDVKCDSELENIINREIDSISSELREISLDVIDIYIHIYNPLDNVTYALI
jgi:hypothetical protein